MNNSSFKISYSKASIGADQSNIIISNSTIDLKDFFYTQKPANNRRLFITDSRVASLECMENFISLFSDGNYENDCLIILGSGERYKNIDTVLSIVQTAMEKGLSKNDTFIGIGGGVICDLTTFAASIYKRGIEVQLMPTTLLAMVDASIGGKTSCDLKEFKNMIGTFYLPSNIYIFTEFTQYTPDSQYRSGLAVALKTALVKDKELFEILKNESEKVLSRDRLIVETIVKRCVKAKCDVIKNNPAEKNINTILDLGNTFAHALESIIGLGTISQGEALAWAIGRVVCLSWYKNYCNEEFKNNILEILKIYGGETQALHPLILGGGIGERILDLMHKDKKNISNKVSLILLKNYEDTIVEDVEDNDILAVLK